MFRASTGRVVHKTEFDLRPVVTLATRDHGFIFFAGLAVPWSVTDGVHLLAGQARHAGAWVDVHRDRVLAVQVPAGTLGGRMECLERQKKYIFGLF